MYGSALPTLTASYSGFVNGDTSASLTTQPTVSTTATAASHVAGSPYSITASGAVDTDYTISYVAWTLTVTKAALTITANNQTKVYGAALPTLTASDSGFVNGDTAASLTVQPTISTTATAASHVSGSPYSITANGAVDSDYSISYVAGSLTVTPAHLSVTANNQSKPYGAPVPILTFTLSGLVNGDTANAVLSGALATSASASSNVGTYHITQGTLAASADYALSYVQGTLAVTPDALDVIANSITRTYGQLSPSFSATYQGFVMGQGPGVLGGSLAFTTAATAASHVQSAGYSVTPSGLTSVNYAIDFVPGTLTIAPAPLSIAANNVTADFGSPVPTLTASYVGFVNGDGIGSLTSPLVLSTSAQAYSLPGNYAIAATGAASPDYKITLVDGTVTVAPPASALERRELAFLSTMYKETLGRALEPPAARYWIGQFAAGAKRRAVARRIWSSPEHRAVMHEHRHPAASFHIAFQRAIRSWNLAVTPTSSRPGGPLSLFRAHGKGTHRNLSVSGRIS